MVSRPPTDQQWRALALMAEGLDQAAIAARMGIARSTLRNHLYGWYGCPGLYERIGAGNDVQAVVWWFQHGWRQCPIGLRPPAREE